jgi:hypothetical protein
MDARNNICGAVALTSDLSLDHTGTAMADDTLLSRFCCGPGCILERTASYICCPTTGTRSSEQQAAAAAAAITVPAPAPRAAGSRSSLTCSNPSYRNQEGTECKTLSTTDLSSSAALSKGKMSLRGSLIHLSTHIELFFPNIVPIIISKICNFT